MHLLSNPDIKIFLIGNKIDLEANRQINTEEGKKYANENGIHFFSETSAKNGFNAKEAFIQAAKVLYLEYLKYKRRGINKGNNDSNNKKINVPNKNSNEQKRKKGGCC